MNVANAIVQGNSDATSRVKSQDKDSGSKQGSGGFSDTLGSLDKGNSSSKGASNGAATSSKGDAPAQSATTDSAATPVAQAPGVATKVVVPTAIFLDTTAIPAQAPSGQLPLNATLPDAKAASTVPETIAQMLEPGDENAMVSDMTDLAKLVTALTKAASPAETDGAVDDGKDGADTDAAPTEGSGENIDILSLLASTVMPTEQAEPQAGASAEQNVAPVLGGAMGKGLTDEPVPESATTSSTVVRVQKQDVPAVDFHIDTQEDGSTKIDVATAAGDVADVVQVVESRRFIGLAATSNAAAITSAMATDPDWATAMSGQTSNSPMIASTGQVVHVLKVQMSPVELGHVTAAMKLVGDELSVQLTAHTLKGYSELQKDSSGILDALKAQGFNVDQVTVTLASNADRQDANAGNRQPADAGQQGAQQGQSQRGNDDRSQEQFYRQPANGTREDTFSHESTSQLEIPARVASARPDHVYL